MGVTNFDIVQANAFIGPFGAIIPQKGGFVKYVDGTYGSDGNSGASPDEPYATIQKGVTEAKAGGVVYVFPQDMGVDGDPVSYAETVTVAATHDRLKIIGVLGGRTQCGLPQVKKGSGSTALLTINAQGVLVANMGFNGAGSTGGGILLVADGSTKDAAGAAIIGCHFKNCKGSSATNAATGGAIQWSSYGGCWQVLIKGNRFYKCVGDVVVIGTTVVPQDVVIEDNVFSGPAASVDCNLFLTGGGSGIDGVVIRNNDFTCFPAIAAGTNVSPMVLTGCVGQLTGNRFATSGKTFGAAGNVLVPTTVFMAGNYQEVAAANDNYQAGHICRT